MHLRIQLNANFIDVALDQAAPVLQKGRGDLHEDIGLVQVSSGTGVLVATRRPCDNISPP